MFIKVCFFIQPLEQGGGCQECFITLCSKVFRNHFYQMKSSPEYLNILIYWSKNWVDRLGRTLRRKVLTGIFYQQLYRLCHNILHQVAHISCSTPGGKQHEPLTGVWGIMIFQIWRSSRHSRLPHRRAHYSTEQVHSDRPVWGQSSKLLLCTYSQLRL